VHDGRRGVRPVRSARLLLPLTLRAWAMPTRQTGLRQRQKRRCAASRRWRLRFERQVKKPPMVTLSYALLCQLVVAEVISKRLRITPPTTNREQPSVRALTTSSLPRTTQPRWVAPPDAGVRGGAPAAGGSSPRRRRELTTRAKMTLPGQNPPLQRGPPSHAAPKPTGQNGWSSCRSQICGQLEERNSPCGKVGVPHAFGRLDTAARWAQLVADSGTRFVLRNCGEGVS
jgi:hypothetical protein